MKRIFAASLCAVAVATFAVSSAPADVNVSLNLEFNNILDPSQGGSWTLVAKTDTTDSLGIVALVTRFLNMPASGTVDPNIGHDILGGLLGIATFGAETEFVYGQDPDPNSMPPGLVPDVGLPAGPSNLVNDPLGNNALWGNSSIIATGFIPDLTILPVFVSLAANENVNNSIVMATPGLTIVRFIPEPATFLLAALGVAVLIGQRRRQKTRDRC